MDLFSSKLLEVIIFPFLSLSFPIFESLPFLPYLFPKSFLCLPFPFHPLLFFPSTLDRHHTPACHTLCNKDPIRYSSLRFVNYRYVNRIRRPLLKDSERIPEDQAHECLTAEVPLAGNRLHPHHTRGFITKEAYDSIKFEAFRGKKRPLTTIASGFTSRKTQATTNKKPQPTVKKPSPSPHLVCHSQGRESEFGTTHQHHFRLCKEA